MVSSWDIKIIVKKKENISLYDYKTWTSYVERMDDVYDKEIDLKKNKFKKNQIKIVDLHGLSLEKANQEIKKIINNLFEKRFNKIKVITGKGLRSNIDDNPYISKEFSILKNTVPEFIKNDKDLSSKVDKIFSAPIEEGGNGAFYIILKKFKE